MAEIRTIKGVRFRVNADESFVCPHRDLTVCPDCLNVVGDLAVDVVGAWYVCQTLYAADELRALIA